MLLVFDGHEGEELSSEAAYAMDESEFGARIQTQAELKAGQIIELQTADNTLPLRCRVVWTGDVASDRVGEAGLEFLLPPSI
jgi:PilZ domain